MEVIAHQAERQQPQAKPIPAPNQPVEVFLPVAVIRNTAFRSLPLAMTW
jgi:hypothetical protein